MTTYAVPYREPLRSTARFEIRRQTDAGSTLEVLDRDGTSRHGAGGASLLLSRLPLTFWFVAPFGLPGLGRAWNALLAPLVGPDVRTIETTSS
jgi:hypothetical protein